jgi:tRNA pseudouridine13 synthase
VLEQAIHALALSQGDPTASGLIRQSPEDFRVNEIPLLEPGGSGEHVWLQVRKRCENTSTVADKLARHAGVHPRNVSYAGQKDRNAVTEQWFSVHLPGRDEPDWSALDVENISVLQHVRHARKLQRGALRGNAFRIMLRDVTGERVQLEQRLQCVRAAGVPNYFGEQRFGRDGSNLLSAERLFANPRLKLSRHQRSMALSAARSLLFNQVLSRRVIAGSWDRPIAGDAMQLNGSHSFFVAEIVDAALRERAAEHDIHPTGPLCGRGTTPVTGECLALETAVIAGYKTLHEGLVAFGLRHERRALRVSVADLAWCWPEDDCLELSFSLPAGSYATAVLRELVNYQS